MRACSVQLPCPNHLHPWQRQSRGSSLPPPASALLLPLWWPECPWGEEPSQDSFMWTSWWQPCLPRPHLPAAEQGRWPVLRQQYSSDHSSSPHGSHYMTASTCRLPTVTILSHTTSGDNMAATFSAEMPVMAQHLLRRHLRCHSGGGVVNWTHWGSLPRQPRRPLSVQQPSRRVGIFFPRPSRRPTTWTQRPHSLPSPPPGWRSSEVYTADLQWHGAFRWTAGLHLPQAATPSVQRSLRPGWVLTVAFPRTCNGHSSIAPPTGFTVTGATATSTNNASPPFTSPNWACLCVLQAGGGNLVFYLLFLFITHPLCPFS